MTRIAVYSDSINKVTDAKDLASKLDITYISNETEFKNYDYVLFYNDQRLALHTTKENFKPFSIDFISDSLCYRRQHISRKNESLVRAIGARQNYKPFIIDVTAGLGRDAFIMANLGCKVMMLERSAVIYSLLKDALDRLKGHPEIFNALTLDLIHSDAIDYLSQLDQGHWPDIIYIDPMFPERDKSALVKKEMRILKDIVGADIDSGQLFETAYQHCTRRVIVKRPRHAKPLVERQVDIVFTGKAIRYDVYLK